MREKIAAVEKKLAPFGRRPLRHRAAAARPLRNRRAPRPASRRCWATAPASASSHLHRPPTPAPRPRRAGGGGGVDGGGGGGRRGGGGGGGGGGSGGVEPVEVVAPRCSALLFLRGARRRHPPLVLPYSAIRSVATSSRSSTSRRMPPRPSLTSTGRCVAGAYGGNPPRWRSRPSSRPRARPPRRPGDEPPFSLCPSPIPHISHLSPLVLLDAQGELVSTDGIRLLRKHTRAFPWKGQAPPHTPHLHPLYDRLLRREPVDPGTSKELRTTRRSTFCSCPLT